MSYPYQLPAGNYRYPSDPVSLYPPEVPNYQYHKLPLITGNSRENGYNPTRVYISGQVREQFDPHPELDDIRARVYSASNIKHLQQTIRSQGLGEASEWELKPFIDAQVRYDRGIYPGHGCQGMTARQISRMRDEAADAINARVVQTVRSNMRATRFGIENYLRDINYHRFPDNPVMEPMTGSNRSNVDDLEFPYYHALA